MTPMEILWYTGRCQQVVLTQDTDIQGDLWCHAYVLSKRLIKLQGVGGGALQTS